MRSNFLISKVNFPEIESFYNIWQFWSRDQNLNQEIKSLKKHYNRLSKSIIIFDFWSHEKFIIHKYNHEIKSFFCTGG